MPRWRQKKGLDLDHGLRHCKVTLIITIAMHSEPSVTSICINGPWRECRMCLTMEMSSSNGRDKHDLHTKCVIQTNDLDLLLCTPHRQCNNTAAHRHTEVRSVLGVISSLLALQFQSKSSWSLKLFTLWTLPMVLY